MPVRAASRAAASTLCLKEKAVSIVFGMSAVGAASRVEENGAEVSTSAVGVARGAEAITSSMKV